MSQPRTEIRNDESAIEISMAIEDLKQETQDKIKKIITEQNFPANKQALMIVALNFQRRKVAY